ncbi:MAG: hypothetical protein ACRD3P_09875 [Terriglobales bacterium]
MEDLKSFYRRVINEKFGLQTDWDQRELESIAREYRVNSMIVGCFRDCLYSLRKSLLLESAGIPASPGIISLAMPGVPNGNRYADGTNIPYPVEFIESGNLWATAQEIRGWNHQPRYVSYAIVDDAERRQLFLSRLREKMGFESQRPVAAFIPATLTCDFIPTARVPQGTTRFAF